MSIQAVAWVLKQEVGDPTAKHVLMCLANYAGEDGENAFPSVARLMRDTELSERAIRGKLSWLVERGFIRLGDQTISAAYAKRKDRSTVCYDFVLRGAPNAPRESTGCISQQNGVHLVPPRGAPPAPNPSYNHQRSVKRKNGASAPLVYPEGLAKEAWEEWIAHRRAKRWPLSDLALKKQLELLGKYPAETQKEIIDRSINADWRGLFPPKGVPAADSGSTWMPPPDEDPHVPN